MCRRNAGANANPDKPDEKLSPGFVDLETDKDAVAVFDRTVKIAMAADPQGFLMLAGCQTEKPVQMTDVAVNWAQHDADGVMLIGDDLDPDRWENARSGAVSTAMLR